MTDKTKTSDPGRKHQALGQWAWPPLLGEVRAPNERRAAHRAPPGRTYYRASPGAPGTQPLPASPGLRSLCLSNPWPTPLPTQGLLQPLVVRPAEGGYQLIAGERRLRACQMAGLVKVPVVVRQATDQQALLLALLENLQREDLDPLEEARAYERLAELILA